jgi:hypothetical protein
MSIKNFKVYSDEYKRNLRDILLKKIELAIDNGESSVVHEEHNCTSLKDTSINELLHELCDLGYVCKWRHYRCTDKKTTEITVVW